MQEARAIQRAMLPTEKLETPRLTVESEFQPVTEVGGDFLDYFLLSDGAAGLYLGDVTGKGLPAALAVGTLRGVHKTETAPSAVLSLLNKRMMLKSVSLRSRTTGQRLFCGIREVRERKRAFEYELTRFEGSGNYSRYSNPQQAVRRVLS